MSSLTDLLNGALGIANQYVQQGITVSVKTNYGPPIQVYQGAADGSSGGSSGGSGGGGGGVVSKLIGLKAAIIVQDASGNVLATYGTPPATDPVRVAVLLALVAGLGYIIIRGLRR